MLRRAVPPSALHRSVQNCGLDGEKLQPGDPTVGCCHCLCWGEAGSDIGNWTRGQKGEDLFKRIAAPRTSAQRSRLGLDGQWGAPGALPVH